MVRGLWSTVLGATALFAGVVRGQPTSPLPPDPPPPPPELDLGWEWRIEPFEFGRPLADPREEAYRGDVGDILSFPGGGLAATMGKHGRPIVNIFVSLAGAGPPWERPEYRVYAIDTEGTARQMRALQSLYTPGPGRLSMITFKPDPRVEYEVYRIGLAVLTVEGRKKIAARALEELRPSGADILPFPVVGEAYPFDLPALSEGRVQSAGLAGKVVLIDFWATWCGPCMAQMPALKELHAKHADKGLVVVGVTLDEDLEAARREIERSGMTWLHSSVEQAAHGHRMAWLDSLGLRSIPRVLVIGRDGLLRSDDPEDLGPVIEAAIGPPP